MLRFLALLFITLALTADAPPTRPYRIFFIGDPDAPAKRAYSKLLDAIRDFQPELPKKTALRYIEISGGQDSIASSLLSLAAEKPDMVVAVSGFEALAAKRAFAHTPIIFASFDEPLEYGIVSSLHSRAEPICGVSLADMLEGKRLEILKQAFPGIRHVGVLADRQWAETMGGRARTEQEAARQGLSVTVLLAEDSAQTQAALTQAMPVPPDAWYIPATPVTDHSAEFIIKQLQTWKKPSIWTSQLETRQGAPMAYSQETDFVWRSLADLIARVHGGEYPGIIPILRPTHFTLTVRMEPASPIPLPDSSIVRRADHIIR